MEIATIVLEYLQVFLSAPVVAGGVTMLGLNRFRNEISGLINRMWKIKTPFGEFEASQQERTRLEPSSKTELPQLEAGGSVDLPENITLTPQIEAVLQSERANAALWEYRYLNYYLVAMTVNVLEVLAKSSDAHSIRLLDSQLQDHVADATEREAIFGALQKHHLVDIANDVLTVTPKGREYLEWRKPSPLLGTTSS